MALSVTSRGVRSITTSSSTYDFSPTSDFTANSFAVLLFGNLSADPISTITDTDGNTWTNRTYTKDTVTANGFYIATADSVSLTTADTITIEWTGNTSSKIVYIFEISGDGVSYVSSDGVEFGGTSATITTPSMNTGELVIAGYSNSGAGTTPTGDSDSTNGSWSAQQNTTLSGYKNAGHQYKVVTGDGTQTYNITCSSSFGAIGYIVLKETVATSYDPFGQFGFFGI